MTGVNRHSVSILSDAIRRVLDAQDERFARFGRIGATAILTAIAAIAIVSLLVLIRALEGLSIKPLAVLNLSLEVAIVATPIIFYSRDIIARLKSSRTRLDEMSRRLMLSAEQAEAANRAKSAFLANM